MTFYHWMWWEGLPCFSDSASAGQGWWLTPPVLGLSDTWPPHRGRVWSEQTGNIPVVGLKSRSGQRLRVAAGWSVSGSVGLTGWFYSEAVRKHPSASKVVIRDFDLWPTGAKSWILEGSFRWLLAPAGPGVSSLHGSQGPAAAGFTTHWKPQEQKNFSGKKSTSPAGCCCGRGFLQNASHRNTGRGAGSFIFAQD